MDPHHDSLTLRALRRVADAVLHHPRWFFWPQIALAVVCVFYTVRSLEFSTSRNALVSDQLHYHRIFLEFRKEFSAEDDIVVIVESETPEKNRQFIERLGARVAVETNLFTDIFFRGDLPMLGSKALQFLEPSQLTELQRTLRDYRPFLDRIATTTNLGSLFQLVNRQFRSAQRASESEQESLVGALPALERIVRQATDSIHRPGTPPSPGVNALFGGGPEAERKVYLTYLNGRMFLLSLRPLSREVTGDAIVRLRELMQLTRLEVPGVNADITGGSILEREEMLQSQRDTLLATVVSLILVALIFIFGYQETGRPLKAMFCLVIGLCYSMGYTTAVVGRLNILTITFAPMLVGMAVDFGVHLITRYEEELRLGLSRQLALRKAMVNTGEGIFTGALTTAGAFFAMAFTDFAGVSEMGIITGGGLLVSLVPMMTMLPVMLLKGRQNQLDRGHPEPRISLRERFELTLLRRAGTVLILSFAFTALCATQFKHVYFDYDLRNLQSKDLPAVEYEKKLMNSTPRSVLFGAVVASNAAHAVALQNRLTNLSSVADVDSIARLLAADPTPKLKSIAGIAADLAPLRLPDPPEAPPNIPDLSQTLWSLQGYLGQAIESVHQEPSQRELEGQLRTLRAALGEFRSVMNAGDRSRATRKLAAFETALFEDLRDTFETLKTQDYSAPLRVEDLPGPIRNRFVGNTGKLLLQVYPNVDVWIRTNQAKFVGELRQVVPDVTGDPVQLYEYTNLLKVSYEEAGWYALAAMAVLVLIQFRSLLAVLLALVPVAFAGAWLLGFMGWFGVPFNPANIMTLPLVVGIGVTYGVHILTRFAEEQDPAILAKSTGKAVLVSGLTTVAGFGSLILAKHQGIVSLGFVMSVGVSTAMLAGLITLPALLVVSRRYAPTSRAQKKTQRH
ncbi:MAG: MMPL family transporter [Verrucomicrobiales bacterium]|nr:MMPL family transporter [Verrucomicrobiales bacterium]